MLPSNSEWPYWSIKIEPCDNAASLKKQLDAQLTRISSMVPDGSDPARATNVQAIRLLTQIRDAIILA